MQLISNSFCNGDSIASDYAFGKYHPSDNVVLCANKNPHLAWHGAPASTKSFVLICLDTEAPSVADHVNQPDKTVAYDLPRADFYHWVMVDIPAEVTSIAEGACSNGVTAKGKLPATGPGREGINDYSGWFAADPDMAGNYYGYDGPCPPWNDERIHQYCFQLFATDLASCPVDGAFTAADVLNALEGHILAKASLAFSYHIYPNAR